MALDNFQLETAELLLQQSCQVAVSMGLHQQVNDSEVRTAADIQERRNVFWTLSVLDKHFTLLTGKSCHLPSYDCDVPQPNPEPENEMQKYFLARIQLAVMQEKIYVSLYSAKAMRASESHVQASVSKLDSELRQWYDNMESPLVVAQEEATSREYLIAIEIHFLYLNNCIMVHRRSCDASDRTRCLDEAKQSLGLLHKIKMSPRGERDATLKRLGITLTRTYKVLLTDE